MDTSTSPTVENKGRQVWPHAFWSLLSLSVLYLLLPAYAGPSLSRNPGWQSLVFSVVLTSACFWSFERCPHRYPLAVKLFTGLCLFGALYITVDKAVAFLTTGAPQ